MPQHNKHLKRLMALTDGVVDFTFSANDKTVKDDLSQADRTDIAMARSIMTKEITQFRFSKLKEARDAYNRAVLDPTDIVSKVILSATEKYDLLRRIIREHTDIPAQLTMAFREQNEMSDEDVDSLISDLRELGLIEDRDLGQEE